MAVRRTLDPIEIGENTSNNIFDSSSVTANENGSVLERLEDLKDDIASIGGGGGGAANLVEQDDVPFSVNFNTTETNILNFSDTTKRYVLRDLVVKLTADPIAETITVRMYKLVNDILTNVDFFDIDTSCWTQHLSIADMFGRDSIASDSLRITVQSSSGNFTVDGQYSWARTL